MTATLYAHPRCSTCRNARRWLDARDLPHEVFDLTASAPPLEILRAIVFRSGLPVRKLFNTSGQAYREGDYRRRLAAMDDEAALLALASDGMLVKRPLLVRGDLVLVGFSPDAYARALEPRQGPVTRPAAGL